MSVCFSSILSLFFLHEINIPCWLFSMWCQLDSVTLLSLGGVGGYITGKCKGESNYKASFRSFWHPKITTTDKTRKREHAATIWFLWHKWSREQILFYKKWLHLYPSTSKEETLTSELMWNVISLSFECFSRLTDLAQHGWPSKSNPAQSSLCRSPLTASAPCSTLTWQKCPSLARLSSASSLWLLFSRGMLERTVAASHSPRWSS